MGKGKGTALRLTLAGLGLYEIWRRSGRKVPSDPVDLHLEDVAEYGHRTGRGNLLGIQPFMVPVDYASVDRFYGKMDGYLARARARGWLNEKTVVVFPEYIGTWLVACREKQALYRAQSLDRAMRWLVFSNLFAFGRALLSARARDKVKDALFRMKAESMALVYQYVFSTLAQKYGVTVVAGSIVLPSPQVRNGRLIVGDGPLYNVSLVYRPDGSACNDVVSKVYPIAMERPFTATAAVTDLPVFDTPAGRLGVLICADSWYPAPYQRLQAQGCHIVVVPNNLVPEGIWHEPWQGYDPGPEPEDVDAADIGSLREGEAWLKYALAGRMASAGAKRGLHVFFRGPIWDLSADGHTVMVDGERVLEADHVDGAAIINFWL